MLLEVGDIFTVLPGWRIAFSTLSDRAEFRRAAPWDLVDPGRLVNIDSTIMILNITYQGMNGTTDSTATTRGRRLHSASCSVMIGDKIYKMSVYPDYISLIRPDEEDGNDVKK